MAFVSREQSGSGNDVNLGGIVAKKQIAGTSGNWTQGSLTLYTRSGGTRNDGLFIDQNGFVTIHGNESQNAFNSTTGRRLMFGGGDGDAQSNYYIGTNLENYGGNYNKLDLRWHTGIRMGAQPGYGGIRFYDTEDLGTQIFAIGKDGSYAQANQSMRAPIFYDLDNTAFYFDGASTTNINTLSGNGKTALETGDSYLRINQGAAFSSGVWFGSSHRLSGTGTYGAWGSNGGTTNSRVYIFGGTYNGTNVIYLDGSSGHTGCFISYADNSHRSPIFYDSNNTGYYLDPATTSELNKVYYNSNMVSRNYGIGQVGLYDASRFQAVFSMGESYLLAANGTGVGNLYGIAWSHPNAGGAAANLASHGMLILENGSFKGAWGGGSFRTPGDVRGTIFYDWDDTGYFTNMAGRRDTNINGFTARTKMTLGLTSKYQFDRADYTGDTSYWIGSMGWGTTDMNAVADWGSGFIDSWSNPGNQPAGTSHWVGTQAFHATFGSGTAYGWQLVGGPIGNLRFRQAWPGWTAWRTVPILDVNDSNGGAMYAGIYYDSNDTGYYTDPASTSRLSTLVADRGLGNSGGQHSLGGNIGSAIPTWNNAQLEIRNTDAGNVGIAFHRAGYTVVGLYHDSGSNLRTNGDFIAAGNVTAYSDIRMKTNIKVIDNALKKVQQLRGVTYDRTDREYNIKQTGVIAQEVLKVLPEAVCGSEEEHYSVAYGNMVGLLIEAIKEQQKQIEELKMLIVRKV
jgi:hypothetical protein